jgi:hypothetical protein
LSPRLSYLDGKDLELLELLIFIKILQFSVSKYAINGFPRALCEVQPSVQIHHNYRLSDPKPCHNLTVHRECPVSFRSNLRSLNATRSSSRALLWHKIPLIDRMNSFVFTERWNRERNIEFAEARSTDQSRRIRTPTNSVWQKNLRY